MLGFMKAFTKPKVKELLQELASGGVTGVRKAWSEGFASGLDPAGLARLLKQCDEGDIAAFMDLAEEMEERDPHYASVLGQRKRAVSGVAAVVKPASETPADEKIAQWVRDHITDAPGFPALIEDLLDAVGKGFSVVEIGWQTNKKDWVPAEFKWRPQRYFKPDPKSGAELRLLDDADPKNGIELAPYKFIPYFAKMKSGHFFRGGIARVVAFSWMCKSYTVKDWTAFVELYGLPLRLGRYDKSATKKDIEVLFRAVANIGTDAAAVVPKSMDIDFVDGSKGGNSQPVFENLARYLDEQISKAVLGQTMTTDNGSSKAQAAVHNDVRIDIAQADARTVCGAINQYLIAPAVYLNFGANAALPIVSIPITEPEDVSARVKDITELAKAGVTFSASEARRLVSMSDPDPKDETFGGQTAETDTATARLALARRETATLDDLAETVLDDWQPTMTELLQPVVDIIESAQSYEEALERIGQIEALPDTRLINGLVETMFAARAEGDVEDG